MNNPWCVWLVVAWPWLAQGALSSSYSWPDGVQLTNNELFDYIVVGAGASGAAAAARLALAGHHVLLVEAGGDPGLLSKIPSAAMSLLGSSMDWQYKTMPNNQSCLSSLGLQCRASRGKCLGGSTSINYMLYTRGNRRDFDDINVPGWSWDDIKPYFLKYEGLQDLHKLPETSRPYHNTSGIMKIGFFDSSRNPWQSRLIESYKALRFPYNYDVNGKSQIGVSVVPGYVYEGERMGTARGYLARPDVKLKLKVAKNTLCTKVIINKSNVARGVVVVQGFQSLRLYARREVILSAGAIGTPHILMLSGVGPSNHLRSLGIKVKASLPVGDNMSDHILPLLIMSVDKRTGTYDNFVKMAKRTGYLAQYIFAQKGPLSSNGLTDVNVFANTHCYDFENRQLLNQSFSGSDCQVPNLQIIHAYLNTNHIAIGKPLFKHIIGLNDNVVDQISKANKQNALILISPILLYPFSRGNIRLASTNPFQHPAIFPNYLSDPRDIDEMVRGIRIVENLADSLLPKKYNSSLLHIALPGCPNIRSDREGYWRCYCRHMTFAVFHSTGTCSLGAVVDDRLRVHHVSRLRIADLGVLPVVPRANTAAVSIAIGERVADFVLEDINKK